MCIQFFFVKQKTAYEMRISDWSSDVCSSDLGHTRGRGKYHGMLGALVVERPDGLRFRIGSGFTDAQRATPPPVGSVVTYRYNGLSNKGVPRFARFLHVRHELPPPDPR